MCVLFYVFRVFIRDILQPIAEINFIFPYFEGSQKFKDTMRVQSYIFDFVDFAVAMTILYLFHKSASQRHDHIETFAPSNHGSQLLSHGLNNSDIVTSTA